MKPFLTFSALALLALTTTACLPEPSVSAKEAYAFATSEGQANGAVFLELSNTTQEDAQITGAKTDVSESVELHTMAMDGDVMSMRKVDNFTVAKGAELSLSPKGDHIMLMGLKAPLKEGEKFPLTLVTSAGEVQTEVKIKAAGAEESGEHEGHEHGEYSSEHGGHE